MFEEIAQQIDEAVIKDKPLYITVEDRNIRSKIHQYVKDKYRATHISRSEYMAHGTEIECCGIWHKTSEYGKCWNGGSMFCDICGEYQFIDYEDEDDLLDEDIRFSLYKPTGSMMICKKGFPYKKRHNLPISYRKHYK